MDLIEVVRMRHFADREAIPSHQGRKQTRRGLIASIGVENCLPVAEIDGTSESKST